MVKIVDGTPRYNKDQNDTVFYICTYFPGFLNFGGTPKIIPRHTKYDAAHRLRNTSLIYYHNTKNSLVQFISRRFKLVTITRMILIVVKMLKRTIVFVDASFVTFMNTTKVSSAWSGRNNSNQMSKVDLINANNLEKRSERQKVE